MNARHYSAAFSFSMRDGALRLTGVLNDFGFFQDYEVGDAPGSLDLRTEHEEHGRFQILNYENLQDSTLHACGFHDPQGDDNWEFDWRRTQRTVACIAGRIKARVSCRSLDQPSFIERGGK